MSLSTNIRTDITEILPAATYGLPPGFSLRDYRILGLAGTGGMGAVYKIEHLITRRVEAMKLLPGGLSCDPDQIQRFEREIQVQARLHHPNIAALYNAVRDGATIALIMEFVEGESLQRMLEDGPLPLPTALDFTAQVLAAVAYAHAAGVIHRDVAPANIIITHDRIAKLTDFGLARGNTDLRLSTSGAPLGSPWYMSPEQVRGIGPIDARTDLYSIGAVLYEMLTGVKPFNADNAFSVMQAHVEAAPAPPSSHNAAIPASIDEIILKAMAKDPAQRFQSAHEFHTALDEAYPLAPGVAGPIAVTPPPPARRPPWFIPMMVAPAAIVSGFGAVAYLRAPAAQPQPVRTAKVVPAPAPAEPVRDLSEAPSPGEPAARPAHRASAAETSSQRVPARNPTRTSKAAPFAIRVTGGEVASTQVAAETAAPQPSGAVALPEPPPEPAAATPVPPPEPQLPVADGGATPAKPGNRLVRALGKINPFRKK